MSELAVWTAYGWIGWSLVAGLQAVAWLLSGFVGNRLFRRLVRVYHLTVLGYWLDRLEREGLRTFQRADDNEET